MKIAAITNLFPPHHNGGYGQQAGLFCDSLRLRGHKLYVLTSNVTSGHKSDYTVPIETERSLEYLPEKLDTLKLQQLNIQNASTTRQFLQRVKPDFVIAFGNDGIGFNVYEAVLSSGLPSLTWLGDTWLGQAWSSLPGYDAWIDFACGGKGSGPAALAKKAIGLSGKARGLYAGPKPSRYKPVSAISDYVLQQLIQAGAPVSGKEKVVPIILDNLFFDSADNPLGHSQVREQALRALFVSRIEYLKGPDVAIRAVAEARNQGGNIRLTLVGFQMSTFRQELENLAIELGVSEYVTWKDSPKTRDLPNIYRNHDVFLFPSRINEGLGVVNCEALACGLPIIGTAHSGSAEVIHDDLTGFRVVKDEHQSMAEHLLYFSENRAELEKLSQQATQFARKFHWSNIISEFEAEMNRILTEQE